MKKNLLLITLLSASLLLYGCSVSHTSKTRGFTYKVLGLEFNCSQTPATTAIKIEKDPLAGMMASIPIPENSNKGGDNLPSARQLVVYCAKFLNREEIPE